MTSKKLDNAHEACVSFCDSNGYSTTVRFALERELEWLALAVEQGFCKNDDFVSAESYYEFLTDLVSHEDLSCLIESFNESSLCFSYAFTRQVRAVASRPTKSE